MEEQLPIAALISIFICTLGVMQMMLGLVSVAGHAWKNNPLMGILCCFIPPVAMYWALLRYKQDNEEDRNLFVLSNYFFGLIFFIMGLVCLADSLRLYAGLRKAMDMLGDAGML